jgi:hypothetical protein
MTKVIASALQNTSGLIVLQSINIVLYHMIVFPLRNLKFFLKEPMFLLYIDLAIETRH